MQHLAVLSDRVQPPLPVATLMAGGGKLFHSAYTAMDRSSIGRRVMRRFDPAVEVMWEGLSLSLRPAGNYSEHLLYASGEPAEPRSLAAVVDLLRGRNGIRSDRRAVAFFVAKPIESARD